MVLKTALKTTTAAKIAILCYTIHNYAECLVHHPLKYNFLTPTGNMSVSDNVKRLLMSSPQFDRKNRIEKVRRGRLALFNKADKLGMIGANVYIIIKMNGKYFIYNSSPEKKWPPSDEMLVC